jgi:preprotein translocase subunit SecG
VLHLVSIDLVASQDIADLLERFSVGFYAVAVPIAWYQKGRGWAIGSAVMAIARAALGGDTVGPHSTMHLTMTWLFIAFFAAAVGLNLVLYFRSRSAASSTAGAPSGA